MAAARRGARARGILGCTRLHEIGQLVLVLKPLLRLLSNAPLLEAMHDLRAVRTGGDCGATSHAARMAVRITGLAHILGQLQASGRDSQTKHCAKPA
jgi:hypothetical protein